MEQLFDYIRTDGVSLGLSLLSAVVLIGIGLRALVNANRACDCPRYLLRHQSGQGLVWKTYHRVDCEEWGS